MSRTAFILNGARTPFARMGTDFARVSAVDLGRAAAVEAMARSGVEPAAVDQTIFGNIATPVDAANISRIIALRAGVPKEKPAHSVSRNCASGIESVVEAARLIATGEADVVLAGGVENMTQIPFLYRDSVKGVFAKAGMAKTPGQRLGALAGMPWKDLLNPVIGLKEGLSDPVCDLGMGDTAEILAKEGHITREDQDRFALRSHQRATEARAKLALEIVPVPVPPDYDRVLTVDNGVRENQTMEALAKLKPVFDRQYGTVTAGNSSQITDGGAAVVVASEEFVAQALPQAHRTRRELGLRGPRARADGPRPVAFDSGRAQEGRPLDEGHRPRRDERGVCGAGPREPQGVRGVEPSSERSRSTSST